ncbi:glycosyltransferase family 2 protein [Burkholderia oklahomensis]|uniref:glycosyltransferase family 2 protein n=1 Tax=Burkholderia oklahomensis TaxID=342113 RepID=UPI00016A8D71|nr:glycosyltransferase family 2 protein [Burkholderia oklahomensis]AJX31072.1 glycosyl transferase 2 family protein [Burkholderia oklahomensis C6786]AOI45114.1 glycosyl transferase [Burkholderia oklahomensis C6786]KUY47797.1 glycosyl transferase [Burkholderia oklahomensis C6786]MBI0358831.1 glycosyltransferase family 2 protein [Burkholderia oklahomensis]SUW57316.1 dTDP-Rha:alpha-D-GlcNAc-pyrophosphate polyprenol, alpha-3-L-rhamnosyltransferase [Burkholderia oklahomensis]
MPLDTALSPSADGLSVSIVVYRPNRAQLEHTLASLGVACDALRTARPDLKISLYLIDNGGLGAVPEAVESLRARGIACEIVSGQGNVGYGRGHNLAIGRAVSRFHLILNPDVDLDRAALSTGLAFLDTHPEAGLVTPWIGDDEGGQQYLCRRYPSLADLFVRGFVPAAVRRLFARRLARYELRDGINARDVFWDPPIVSGCFMLFRTDVLTRLHGFDPRYFLYFEDYDLSLRTHEIARVVYVPSVRVIHYGGGASRKGVAHIRMFGASAFKFFNRFGWRVC